MIQVNAIEPSKIEEMTTNMHHTLRPGSLRIGLIIELVVAEGTDRPNGRAMFAKMGDAVANPGFEIPWIEPQITAHKGKLARQVITIIERDRGEGLVQGQ